MSIKSSFLVVVRYQNFSFLSLLLLIGVALIVTLDGTWSFQPIITTPIQCLSPKSNNLKSSFIFSRGQQRQQNYQLTPRSRSRSSRFDTNYDNNRNNYNHKTPIIHALPSLSLSLSHVDDDDYESPSESDKSDDHQHQRRRRRRRLEKKLSLFTLLTPLWTLLVSFLSISNYTATLCSKTVGSLFVMQKAYTSLMFVMGLTINNNNNDDLSTSSSASMSSTSSSSLSYKNYPPILFINACLCFAVMPFFANCLAKGLSYSRSETIGIILLGCVGGGQASNLFTLIAGGDVGLSIICTISTTLLGVVATPLLVSKLLGSGVTTAIRGVGGAAATGYYTVVKSISSLILLPIIAGSITARIFPKTIQKVSAFLPPLGVLSTLVLVAGGSSTTFVTVAKSTTFSSITGGGAVVSAILMPSILLSIMGALAAWCVTSIPIFHVDERTRKTIVMETLSKSPTLAYVLAIKHFDTGTAAASIIPAAAMVTLAVIGALLASIWATISNTSTSTSSSTMTSTSTTE